MKTLATLAVLFASACGVPDYSAFPMTRCGLHYEGVSASEVQTAEDVIVDVFKNSLDPSLHNVCTALSGWKLTVTSKPIIPGDLGSTVLDDADPSLPVDGVSLPETMEIRVFSTHFVLPHEAAHVAQGCTTASGLHTDWNNVCANGVPCVCIDRLDTLGGPCTPGLVQPQLIEARSQLDVRLGDTTL